MPTNIRKSSSDAPKGGNGSVAGAETGTNGGTTHGLLGGIKQNVTARADEQKNREVIAQRQQGEGDGC